MKSFEELIAQVEELEVGSDEAEEVLLEMQKLDEERFLAWLDEVYTRPM